MEHHQPAVPTCSLKVNINCCTMCQLKAKEKLQKIKGVEAVVYDSKGVVTVSGRVNPMIIVKKLEEWGKHAELLSFQKSPKQDDGRGTPRSTKNGSGNSVQGTPRSSNKGRENSVHNGSHIKEDKDSCCRCDAMSDSDDHDHNYGHDDDDCKAPATKNSNDPNIIWPKPDLLTINKRSKKSSGWRTFLALFCKKKKLNEKKSGATMLGKPSTKDGQSKWQFPRMHTPDYGGSKPYQQRPLQPYPPPVTARPSAPPYQPFWHMQPVPPPYPPVVPPPYGFFNSRPPPKINPMIHYTSYADNYSFL